MIFIIINYSFGARTALLYRDHILDSSDPIASTEILYNDLQYIAKYSNEHNYIINANQSEILLFCQ